VDKFIKFSAQTNAQGALFYSIKIPGVFTGLDRSLPGYNGRRVVSALVKFDSTHPADAITGLSVQDTDGIIPAGIRGLFPAYPILGTWDDPDMPAENKGIWLSAYEGTTIEPPVGNDAIASGLYIVFGAQTGDGRQDTLRITGKWGDLK
jgi:hypothetical protein